ncbi:MAG: hypothetical protein LC746_13945 [Acidobacteria bacterium]|nr:hypothetical protein [Acidobacteriota bacterium]
MKLLTNQSDREEARLRLRELLALRGEWFCAEVEAPGSRRGVAGRAATSRAVSASGAAANQRAPASAGKSFSLRAGEWDVRARGGALHFVCWTDEGARAWRVEGWGWSGGKLTLRVARRMGAERATLELVPRASVREGELAVAAARRAACERFAETVRARPPGARVESARLSVGARRSEPGRYARVVLVRGRRERVAATCPVVTVKRYEVDSLLASALAWWSRAGAGARAKKQTSATRLWLVVARELSQPVAERLALLREAVRDAIELFESDDAALRGNDDAAAEPGGLEDGESAVEAPRSDGDAARVEPGGAKGEGNAEGGLRAVEVPPLETLVARAARFRRPPRAELSDMARRLVALAPESVDVIRARHGETLRFHGLPFARVRRVAGCERVWFGAAGAGQKVLLDEGNWRQLAKLVAELDAHRRAGCDDPRHAYYRAAPEAWLESVLRRDITRLDPGLVVSPLHAQLRTAREAAGARPVDLLALRRDGRLVVIELKVSEAAALPLQGADYWRRVEAHRRAGDLRRARLFGDLEVSDEPPLVYLVAPLFRFHRAFATLARMISPEVEMYRFDINEDWRSGVGVVRRSRVN